MLPVDIQQQPVFSLNTARNWYGSICAFCKFCFTVTFNFWVTAQGLREEDTEGEKETGETCTAVASVLATVNDNFT